MTISERLIAMREDMRTLVSALNSARRYGAAMEAQVVLINLHKLEDDHDFTNAIWPPQIDEEGELAWEPQFDGGVGT